AHYCSLGRDEFGAPPCPRHSVIPAKAGISVWVAPAAKLTIGAGAFPGKVRSGFPLRKRDHERGAFPGKVRSGSLVGKCDEARNKAFVTRLPPSLSSSARRITPATTPFPLRDSPSSLPA